MSTRRLCALAVRPLDQDDDVTGEKEDGVHHQFDVQK